jgi:predicted nicotinamide N-methyase
VDLVEESVPLRGVALQVLRPRDAEALLDERAFEHEEYLPYWAELWPSGVALARRVAARALRGARVLELGCGLGLPSLAAALAGGRVLATDWSPQAIELLRDNAARNDAELELEVVDWQRPAPLLERAPWDLVLGADLLYERRNVAPLLELVPELLGERGELWLADPGRAPADDFLAEFERLAEDADGRVTVYRLRPR